MLQKCRRRCQCGGGAGLFSLDLKMRFIGIAQIANGHAAPFTITA